MSKNNKIDGTSLPLVSIVVLNYNSEDTLPFALSSILAQTYSNWECIVVDDGSKVSPARIIEKINDKRFRLVTHKKNMGRGAARQTGLDNASGDYLAMVDSDDWIYPEKLQKQMAIFKKYPELTIVSCGPAITDKDNTLRGLTFCRKSNEIVQTYSKIGYPPFAHASSIIKMDAAKAAGYKLDYRFNEDVNFLMRAGYQKKYVVLGEAMYAYKENISAIIKKKSKNYRYQLCDAVKSFRINPLESVKWIIKVGIISISWFVLNNLGFGQWVVKRRSAKPTLDAIKQHKKALAKVKMKYEENFNNK